MLLTLGWLISHCWEVGTALCTVGRLAASGLYRLDANSTSSFPQFLSIKNVSRHCQMVLEGMGQSCPQLSTTDGEGGTQRQECQAAGVWHLLAQPPRVLWEVAKDTLYQRFKKFFSDGSFGHLGELCSDFCAGWKWEREVRTPPIVSLNSVRMMGVLEHQRSSGGTLFTEKVIMFVIVISKPKGIIIMVWFTEIFAFVH